MTAGLYIWGEDKRTPVEIDDILQWATWFQETDRTVARTTVGVQEVSTIFLAMDHSFGQTEMPVLYETMVFGGPYDQQITLRYETYEMALAGHESVVKALQRREADPSEPLQLEGDEYT